jgi:hypothetical protein
MFVLVLSLSTAFVRIAVVIVIGACGEVLTRLGKTAYCIQYAA